MIPAATQPSKILNNAEEICQAFQIGKRRLNWWRQQPGFPIHMICGRVTGHYDDIERFMREYLLKKTSQHDEN